MSDRDRSPDSPDSEGPNSEDSAVHRRGFFTEGFRHLLRPLADMVERRMQSFDPSIWEEPGASSSIWDGSEDESPYSMYSDYEPPPEPKHLRPPGALPEDEFLARCTSSNHCVQACPVSAIRLVWSGDSNLNGKPAIEPEVQACVLCEDLSCMKACPTGALQAVPREEIRVGLAVLKRDHCLRAHGEDCRICVDKCPLGRRAIEVPYSGSDVSVNPDGCVGCGVCEMYCPAQPRAIIVERQD